MKRLFRASIVLASLILCVAATTARAQAVYDGYQQYVVQDTAPMIVVERIVIKEREVIRDRSPSFYGSSAYYNGYGGYNNSHYNGYAGIRPYSGLSYNQGFGGYGYGSQRYRQSGYASWSNSRHVPYWNRSGHGRSRCRRR